eukprot:scaffold59931_cov60-Phaeocystis_antarctica.AAC.1
MALACDQVVSAADACCAHGLRMPRYTPPRLVARKVAAGARAANAARMSAQRPEGARHWGRRRQRTSAVGARVVLGPQLR